MTFGYDEDRKILNNINISVMHGEQVTLSGRTGAGKSTIFKLFWDFTNRSQEKY